MFDYSGKSDSGYLRKLSLILGALSLLLFAFLIIRDEVERTQIEDDMWFDPISDTEIGLIYGAMLGLLVALCLLTIDLLKRSQAHRKNRR